MEFTSPSSASESEPSTPSILNKNISRLIGTLDSPSTSTDTSLIVDGILSGINVQLY